ncbi:MAG TPA: hypothetical protein VEJ63_21230 [Planctomycetota bacterium]|nr:hypothetical protein [Planctomycetota bacterium]
MTSFADKLATATRFCLVAGIAIVGALILSDKGAPNPFELKRATAEGGIAAAPGYLALTTNAAGSRFYIIDKNKQVICVYTMTGDKLRLQSVRKFDFDSDIFAGDIATPKYKGIEGGNGIDRAEAKEYSEQIKKMRDDFEKKK